MNIADQAEMLEKKKQGPATQLEAFLAKKGSLIIKDFYHLGNYQGNHSSQMAFTALVFSSPGAEMALSKGLRIEITENIQYEKTSSAMLDVDELESLKGAVEYILRILPDWRNQTKEYAEIIFSTKGDFNIGVYQKGNNQAAFASVGSYDTLHCFFLKITDLNIIKSITEKAISLLQSK